MTALAIENALRSTDGAALVTYLVGGYPNRSEFAEHLVAASHIADVVEVGVPFSDPLADGLTIQHASSVALSQGTHLRDLLAILKEVRHRLAAPVVLMSYLNPLEAYGFTQLAADASHVGVSGFILPDLPYEEAKPYRAALSKHHLALIPLITPVTPLRRVTQLCKDAQGFVYAVTRTGVTGGSTHLSSRAVEVLKQARKVSPVPVLAGFGVRNSEQVQQLADVADGVIVGSALIECFEQQKCITPFLLNLRPQTVAIGGAR